LVPKTSVGGGLASVDVQSIGDTNANVVAGKTYVQLVTALTAPRTWNFALASSYLPGQLIAIVDAVGSGGVSATNYLTIVFSGTDTFQGITYSPTFTTGNGALLLVCDGVKISA